MNPQPESPRDTPPAGATAAAEVLTSEAATRVLFEMPVMLVAFDAQGSFCFWNRECERVTGYTAAEIVGRADALERLIPDATYRGRLLAEWRQRGDTFRDWESEFTGRDGRTRTIAWSSVAQHVPIPSWQSWCLGVDVTGHRRSEAELERIAAEKTAELRTATRSLREDLVQREQLGRRLREAEAQFQAVAESVPVAVAITRLADGRIVFVNPFLADRFRVPREELVGRDSREFYVHLGDFDRLYAAVRGGESVRDVELEVRRPDGSLGWVLLAMRPVTFGGEPCALASVLDITQIKAAEQVVRREADELQRMLELHVRDRQLIAYDIHDGIVQEMTGAVMFLEAFRYEAGDTAGKNESFRRGLSLIRESIAEARRLIGGLRPPRLDEEGIVPALQELVEQTAAMMNIEPEFVADVTFGRAAPPMELAIYRIVQEALNNVWKHSQSKKVRIELVERAGRVSVIVQDWGVGFDPASTGTGRHGLIGIRERARLLGGEATIDSAPASGTRICAEFPLQGLAVG